MSSNVNNNIDTKRKRGRPSKPTKVQKDLTKLNEIPISGKLNEFYKDYVVSLYKQRKITRYSAAENIIKSFTKSINFSEYLGVHIRGTDSHLHGKKLTIESIIKKIDTAFSQAKHSKIFVMSDEQEYVDIVKSDKNRIRILHFRDLPQAEINNIIYDEVDNTIKNIMDV
jgi:hypothetical protein